MSFTVSKAEVGTWLEPPTVFSVAKAEVGAWIEPPTVLSVAKAEIGVWLEPGAGGGRRRQMIIC